MLHLVNLQSYNLIKPSDFEKAVLYLYSLEDTGVANGNGHMTVSNGHVTPSSKEQSPIERSDH